MGKFVIPRAQTLRFVQVFGNLEKSQIFTRNNCGEGSQGTPVTYTVPANKYFSYLSQAEADQLAINDITLNGQTYANQFGSCIFMNYIFDFGFETTDLLEAFGGSAGWSISIESNQLRVITGIGLGNFVQILPLVEIGGLPYILQPGNYRALITMLEEQGTAPSAYLRYGSAGMQLLNIGENIIDFTLSSYGSILIRVSDVNLGIGGSFLFYDFKLQSL